MSEIIRELIRTQGEGERFTPRTFFDQDHPPGVSPPPGYTSWDDYYGWLTKGQWEMATFATPGTTPRGRKASMVFTRTGEDVATIGMHFLSRDGSDALDFTDANEVTINARLLTLWNAIKSMYGDEIAFDRVIWHAWGVGVRRPNPATNEYAISPAVAGTGDAIAQLPPQTAMSVTFKTAVRKQWGRCYLPAPISEVVVSGRFLEATVDLVRTAFGNLLEGASDDNLPLVVWSPRHGGGPLTYGDGSPAGRIAAHEAGNDNPDTSSFARSVTQVQVDDVVDVIRSRRFSTPLVRATHTLGG